jgi:heme/copper-type cytochrome/quinol oxidase subunit 1
VRCTFLLKNVLYGSVGSTTVALVMIINVLVLDFVLWLDHMVIEVKRLSNESFFKHLTETIFLPTSHMLLVGVFDDISVFELILGTVNK